MLVLFAGPHNWIEARYMLSRLPSRFAPVAPYMTTGVWGVVLLGASAPVLPGVARATPLVGQGDDALTMRLVRVAGGELVSRVPAHFLVASHVLAEAPLLIRLL